MQEIYNFNETNYTKKNVKKEIPIMKCGNWYFYLEGTKNINYLYGTQLYTEFEECDEYFEFSKRKPTNKFDNFEEYLNECVRDFLESSPWHDKVSFITSILGL